MSKQIALLIDNSGSMFSPMAGGGTNDKIFETAQGAEMFIADLISELSMIPTSQFAVSVHRFAQNYQLLPGGAQVDTNHSGFVTALATMQSSISTIENQAASQTAVGNLTDVYDAVRQTAQYLLANPPAFGVASGIYILLFSDGMQTICYDGGNDMLSYEAATGVNFSTLLNGNNIRLRVLGIGSNTLPGVLRLLTDQAFDPSSLSEVVPGLPGSYTKVLFPESVLDSMARGVLKKFNLGAHAEPFQILTPGKVVITASPSVEGKPAEGNLRVTAQVLGGKSITLESQDDGTFSGPVEITCPGINPIRVEVKGELEKKKSMHRFEFTEVLLGPAADFRFTVNPNTYEQGRKYTVELNLQDAQFRRSSQVLFGSGIQVTGFQMLNATAAKAQIRVASDAFVGTREVVTSNPNAESLGVVRVAEAKDAGRLPGSYLLPPIRRGWQTGRRRSLRR